MRCYSLLFTHYGNLLKFLLVVLFVIVLVKYDVAQKS